MVEEIDAVENDKKIKGKVEIVDEEIMKMNRLLGVNFGADNRMDFIDLTEGLEVEDWWIEVEFKSILSNIFGWIKESCKKSAGKIKQETFQFLSTFSRRCTSAENASFCVCTM